jgi:hypothetical protein
MQFRILAALIARGLLGSFPPLLISPVGWVERSDTHQCVAQKVMGFASLYPSYGTSLRRGFVGWAKRQRAQHQEARSAIDGGHGAFAPLPTLRRPVI